MLFATWLVLLFWYNIHRGKRFAELIAVQSDEASKASGIVVDSFSNHLSVRIFNARKHEKQLLMRQQDKIIRAWRKSWLQNIVTNVVKGQSAALVSALALVLVLMLYAHGTVPLGGIVLFIAYFGDASSSLWQLAWALDNYYRNFGTIQNALDGLNADDEPEGHEASGRSHLDAVLGESGGRGAQETTELAQVISEHHREVAKRHDRKGDVLKGTLVDEERRRKLSSLTLSPSTTGRVAKRHCGPELSTK
jgi:ABC-type multidrug transport system fused ATPase/permease subunit